MSFALGAGVCLVCRSTVSAARRLDCARRAVDLATRASHSSAPVAPADVATQQCLCGGSKRIVVAVDESSVGCAPDSPPATAALSSRSGTAGNSGRQWGRSQDRHSACRCKQKFAHRTNSQLCTRPSIDASMRSPRFHDCSVSQTHQAASLGCPTRSFDVVVGGCTSASQRTDSNELGPIRKTRVLHREQWCERHSAVLRA